MAAIAPSKTHSGRLPDAALVALSFADLAGFAEDDHRAAFGLFAQHAAAILKDTPPLRPAVTADQSLRDIFRRALAQDAPTQETARKFFEDNFVPHRIVTQNGGRGFVTGYYEPVIQGARSQCAEFAAPVLAWPDDLVTLAAGETLPGIDPSLSAARRLPDGRYEAYPERAAIEAGALGENAKPLAFLRDKVDVFFAQVQGSARVALPDGGELRLTYAGRNGHPYTSIGKALIEMGELAADDVDMDRVKGWIRAKGQGESEPGSALMLRNKSYIFFAENTALGASDGPIGGAGLSLKPLRSIAIDRQIWAYGLPFWLAADLPWESAAATPFNRLMIASDTGSAILGAARADIFFGSGDAAGARAGTIRHPCDFAVLLPRAEA
ncbi:MAG: murein transglycosylase A [Methylovirgula sp.]